MIEKGLIQVYTGNGKGKTTAAFGSALRAAGCGNCVLIYQFLKPPSLQTGERDALKNTPNITLDCLDIDWNMQRSFEDKDFISKTKAAVKEALSKLTEAACKKTYDMIILDEIVYCLRKGLADVDDIKVMADKKHPQVELILTGSGATEELLEMADLATEMKKIKHPFDKGINARKAIEF